MDHYTVHVDSFHAWNGTHCPEMLTSCFFHDPEDELLVESRVDREHKHGNLLNLSHLGADGSPGVVVHSKAESLRTVLGAMKVGPHGNVEVEHAHNWHNH